MAADGRVPACRQGPDTVAGSCTSRVRVIRRQKTTLQTRCNSIQQVGVLGLLRAFVMCTRQPGPVEPPRGGLSGAGVAWQRDWIRASWVGLG